MPPRTDWHENDVESHEELKADLAALHLGPPAAGEQAGPRVY